MSREKMFDIEGMDSISRRKILTLAGLGMTGLAGCPSGGGEGTETATGTEPFGDPFETDTPGDGNGDGGDATPTPAATDEATAFVEGQTLVIPHGRKLDEFSYNYANIQMYHELQFAHGRMWAGHGPAGPFVPPVLLGRWENGSFQELPIDGHVHTPILSTFDWQEDRIHMEIRDDANWNDGEPVRAMDLAFHATLKMGDRGSYRNEEGLDPKNLYHNVLDVAMPDGADGKTVELVYDSEATVWNETPPGKILGNLNKFGGIVIPAPTHITPYKEMAEAGRKNLEVMKNNPDAVRSDDYRSHLNTQNADDFYDVGELWDPDKVGDGARHESLQAIVAWGYATTLGYPDWVEWGQQPENVYSHGAWNFVENRSPERFVFEPNEHWWGGSPNFDGLELVWQASGERAEAQLMAGETDISGVQLAPEAEQEVPDRYAQQQIPSWWGQTIAVNHRHFALGNRNVRQAMAYALNESNIAAAINADLMEGISYKGAEGHFVDQVADMDFLTSNLIDYSQDLDQANSLMQDAGFAKNGDGVWELDGEAFTLEIPTTSDTPDWELVLADQLNQFGIEANVQAYDGHLHGGPWYERLKSQSFNVWAPHLNSTFAGLWNNIPGSFLGNTYNRSPIFNADGYFHEHYPDKAEKALDLWGVEDGDTARSVFTDMDPETRREFFDTLSVEMPPIGEPDTSPTETFKPWLEAYLWQRGEQQMTADLFQKFAWFINWELPGIPLYNRTSQLWMNFENWNWPTDHAIWPYLDLSIGAEESSGYGWVSANPDNPKDGAQVVNR